MILLKGFLLNSTRVNHVSHFVHQKEVSLPEELVRGAQGQIAFKEQNPWVGGTFLLIGVSLSDPY